MRYMESLAARATVAGAFMLSLAFTSGAVRAQDKTYVMKISTPTLNDSPHQFAKNFGAAVERDSGGRIKAEVYPASQLGSIPRQIEGTQFGAIQCEVVPPEFFVGVDERFEVLTAPGLVDTLDQGQRLAADPAVQKLMLSLGADKGLHGVGLFEATPSSVIARSPLRHLDDFKGKRLRVFASQFQMQAMQRLGATPVAMTLGDVMPALQQGAIDGAIAAVAVYATFHYADAAKYVTETNQPAIFIIVEISKKWYETLPADLQQIVDRDAAKEAVAIGPWAKDFDETARKNWMGQGGELISLPREEQSAMLNTLVSVGEDVSKTKPGLADAYQAVKAAAQRVR
jgi:TRAP-type C4-dicarboxylate transport system substrate-binding protein